MEDKDIIVIGVDINHKDRIQALQRDYQKAFPNHNLVVVPAMVKFMTEISDKPRPIIEPDMSREISLTSYKDCGISLSGFFLLLILLLILAAIISPVV